MQPSILAYPDLARRQAPVPVHGISRDQRDALVDWLIRRYFGGPDYLAPPSPVEGIDGLLCLLFGHDGFSIAADAVLGGNAGLFLSGFSPGDLRWHQSRHPAVIHTIVLSRSQAVLDALRRADRGSAIEEGVPVMVRIGRMTRKEAQSSDEPLPVWI